MKVNMVELRQLVAETIRRTLIEAKKKADRPKSVKHDISPRTEDAELQRRDKHVRATGYSHMNNGDFSRSRAGLEPDYRDINRYGAQGASNIGGFTGSPIPEGKQMLQRIVEQIVAEEIRAVVSENEYCEDGDEGMDEANWDKVQKQRNMQRYGTMDRRTKQDPQAYFNVHGTGAAQQQTNVQPKMTPKPGGLQIPAGTDKPQQTNPLFDPPSFIARRQPVLPDDGEE